MCSVSSFSPEGDATSPGSPLNLSWVGMTYPLHKCLYKVTNSSFPSATDILYAVVT